MIQAFPLGGLGMPTPTKWRETTFGAICDANGGQVQTGPFGSQLHAYDYEDEGTPVVMPQDLVGGEVSTAQVARVNDSHVERLKKHKLVAGDVVYSRRGDVTRFAIATKREVGWLCGTGCMRIRPDCRDLDANYLRHYLSHAAVKDWLVQQAKGATMPNLNTTILRALPVLLPPLSEQKRIAGILDKADAIRRKRQQAIGLTEQFLRSTFLDMFGDPVTNPKGWPTGTLGDAVHSAKDGPHVSPEYSDDGIPFLSTRHIKPDGVVWDDLKFITRDEAQRQWRKCKPERGDILYTKGGTTGIATAIDFDDEIAVWVHCALLKTKHDCANPYWLAAMLNTPYCYAQSQRFTHGITNKDLGLTRMVKIKMYLPPLEAQRKYADAATRGKAMRERFQTLERTQDDLFNSLVQRAFRGDL